MGRKSRIVPVLEYLEEAHAQTRNEQDIAVAKEHYRDAEIYKSFRTVLLKAIGLCWDVKTEVK